MGFFGTYILTGDIWSRAPELAPEAVPRWVSAGEAPWLYMEIHDSDLTILRYEPAGPGSGIAYLGYTPRTYFEDDDASEPTDVDAEAAGLAAWLALRPGAPAGVDASVIKPYLAEDLGPPDAAPCDAAPCDSAGFDEAEEFDDDIDTDIDEGEIFVEIKTARLLRQLGLPLPDDLPRPPA